MEKHLNFDVVGANFLNAITHSKSHQSSSLLTCLASAASDTSEYLNISFVRLVEDGEERMQSSDYRPEVRRHSVICQVSSVCTRLFTLCSHRASSEHRPPVSEAFVAAARAEGAGHLVSGTASHAASNIIIRSHEGGHPLMFSIQRRTHRTRNLVRWNHQILRV